MDSVAMEDVWWDRWWTACTTAAGRIPCDLGDAVIDEPGVAVTCWTDATTGRLQVIVDRAWWMTLVAAGTGDQVTTAVSQAVRRWRWRGGVVRLPPTAGKEGTWLDGLLGRRTRR